MDVFFSPRVHSDAAVERIGSDAGASESVQHLKDSAKGNNNTKKCCIASVCLLGSSLLRSYCVYYQMSQGQRRVVRHCFALPFL